ncbi:MAG: A/G-specific adenine glycosylase [Verrucomicrobia bacterium]|nr:A/G-specific adenine glycosylase [Verrucomicrobiota bacterium]
MPALPAIVRSLLTWYARAARDLPWRRTRDPYAIWVSEVMLQQTQVKTVVPYWERWMRALPTLDALARAAPGRVLKLWEGLGYYTRARNLQRAAQVIRTRHGGRFPSSFAEVLALPGVGRYTAGAICSLAYNQPTPVLDGNVRRVLARVFGVEAGPTPRAADPRLWALAQDLVVCAAALAEPAQRACADLNQALMELGATVCAPSDPRCPACPLRRGCVARRDGRTAELPGPGRRVPVTRRHFVAFVLQRRGRFWVRQRPEAVVNGGLWEFPNVEIPPGLRDGRRHGPAAEHLAKNRFGISGVEWQPFGRIQHTITRYRITLEVYRARSAGAVPPAAERHRWGALADLKRLAFASAHGKILCQLEQEKVRRPTG